jgi:hypothetical protein
VAPVARVDPIFLKKWAPVVHVVVPDVIMLVTQKNWLLVIRRFVVVRRRDPCNVLVNIVAVGILQTAICWRK